jgi:hypothetical protein
MGLGHDAEGGLMTVRSKPVQPGLEDLNQEDLREGRAFARVKARISVQQRLWYWRCTCPCTCGIQHNLRKSDTCILCRDGDHYVSLVSYLKKIEKRAADKRAEADYYAAVDRETYDQLAAED